MPIAQIYVAPSALKTVEAIGATLVESISEALFKGLDPARDTIQVMLVPTIGETQGCDILCVVQHRASEQRTKQKRQATADALHDLLHRMTKQSVRVRLIALSSDTIAAKDTDRSQ